MSAAAWMAMKLMRERRERIERGEEPPPSRCELIVSTILLFFASIALLFIAFNIVATSCRIKHEHESWMAEREAQRAKKVEMKQ